MSRSIDLNADLGEEPWQKARDIALMQNISSCNIACGGHAGDAASMAMMLAAARAAGVAAGAHPSYPDRAGFGRATMTIALPDLLAALLGQVRALQSIAVGQGTALTHIKPHGALYNDLADRPEIAGPVAAALHAAFPDLALVGLAHGAFETAVHQAGARFIAEGFVDRGYTRARRLIPRGQPGALIAGDDARAAQAVAIATGAPINATGAPVNATGVRLNASDGSTIVIIAQSLCIHSDSPGSEQTALRIGKEMASIGIAVRPPGENAT